MCMNYYVENPSNEKISETDLLNLGNNLKQFVNEYFKHIYLDEENQLEILRRIDFIAGLINSRQYYQLFDNPGQIDYDYNPESNHLSNEYGDINMYDVPF